jgi:hypothetical protein
MLPPPRSTTHPPPGEFLLLPALPAPSKGAEWSAAEADVGGDVAYLATPEGELTVIDARAASAAARDVAIHDRKVNTLALLGADGGVAASAPGAGRLLASSCSDGCVSVWDVRQLPSGGTRRPAAVSALRHAKSSQGAAWATDASGRLLSISFDDTLRVWGPDARTGGGGGAASAAAADAGAGKGMQQLLSVRHNNNTGRWVIPFRPAWFGSDCFVVGDMKRGVAAFDAAAGTARGLLQAEALTAIPSRLAAWCPGAGGAEGGAPMLAVATSSGRVHVFR